MDELWMRSVATVYEGKIEDFKRLAEEMLRELHTMAVISNMNMDRAVCGLLMRRWYRGLRPTPTQNHRHGMTAGRANTCVCQPRLPLVGGSPQDRILRGSKLSPGLRYCAIVAAR